MAWRVPSAQRSSSYSSPISMTLESLSLIAIISEKLLFFGGEISFFSEKMFLLTVSDTLGERIVSLLGLPRAWVSLPSLIAGVAMIFVFFELIVKGR